MTERRPIEASPAAGALLVLCTDIVTTPALTLPELLRERRAGEAGRGWGVVWHPDDDFGIRLLGEPTASAQSALLPLIGDAGHVRARLLLAHRQGDGEWHDAAALQPIVRPWAGRTWSWCRLGDEAGAVRRLTEGVGRDDDRFRPVGSSAAEAVGCQLLHTLEQLGARRLADLAPERLHEVLLSLDDLGLETFVVSDGDDVAVYQGRALTHPLAWRRVRPTAWYAPLATAAFTLALAGAHERRPTAIVIASMDEPTPRDGWAALLPGQLLLVRAGEIGFDSHVGDVPIAGSRPPQPYRRVPPAMRTLLVEHRTVYRYAAPVRRSAHLFRLRPVIDAAQTLQAHRLSLSVGGRRSEFEDVFGNHAVAAELESAYDELVITSESRIRVDAAQGLVLPPLGRHRLPLVWMPWQRQMMLPYLLPPELPESELRELSDYAAAAVRRADRDLVGTLGEINATIHRDYAYVSGSTSLETTPFEVYQHRRGVCQDFANLFICLARLLGLPARYRTGYIHTGNEHGNRLQSDASHAWVEVYIPECGWRGFDPTNGTLAGADHVRVACGRHFRDAAPTSGTIFAGGGGETLEVQVRVEPVE
jgi:transglutaminase-like putative cysteine protease/predicted glutamine amidotransferase